MTYNNGVFARNLKVERARRGWTQAVLAEEAGLNVNNIARYETGETVPGLEAAYKIALALECSIDSLVGYSPAV